MRLSTVLIFSIVLLASAAHAADAQIEVQAVNASHPGKNSGNLPKSLEPYRSTLRLRNFMTFTDAGKQSVKLSQGKGAANLNGYALEFQAKEKGSPVVTIKKNGKEVGRMSLRGMKKDDPFPVQVGPNEAPTIFLFTPKE